MVQYLHFRILKFPWTKLEKTSRTTRHVGIKHHGFWDLPQSIESSSHHGDGHLWGVFEGFMIFMPQNPPTKELSIFLGKPRFFYRSSIIQKPWHRCFHEISISKIDCTQLWLLQFLRLMIDWCSSEFDVYHHISHYKTCELGYTIPPFSDRRT